MCSFAMVSVVLWSKTLLLDHEQLPQLLNIDLNIMLYMLLVSIVTGLGYAAWNIGINQGNIATLVALSYFSPIFSSIISMWVLNTSLSHTFLDRYNDGYLRFIYLLAVNQLG